MKDQNELTHQILKTLLTNTPFYHLMDMLVTICEYQSHTYGSVATQKGRGYKKLAEACEKLALRAKCLNL